MLLVVFVHFVYVTWYHYKAVGREIEQGQHALKNYCHQESDPITGLMYSDQQRLEITGSRTCELALKQARTDKLTETAHRVLEDHLSHIPFIYLFRDPTHFAWFSWFLFYICINEIGITTVTGLLVGVFALVMYKIKWSILLDFYHKLCPAPVDEKLD